MPRVTITSTPAIRGSATRTSTGPNTLAQRVRRLDQVLVADFDRPWRRPPRRTTVSTETTLAVDPEDGVRRRVGDVEPRDVVGELLVGEAADDAEVVAGVRGGDLARGDVPEDHDHLGTIEGDGVDTTRIAIEADDRRRPQGLHRKRSASSRPGRRRRSPTSAPGTLLDGGASVVTVADGVGDRRPDGDVDRVAVGPGGRRDPSRSAARRRRLGRRASAARRRRSPGRGIAHRRREVDLDRPDRGRAARRARPRRARSARRSRRRAGPEPPRRATRARTAPRSR